MKVWLAIAIGLATPVALFVVCAGIDVGLNAAFNAAPPQVLNAVPYVLGPLLIACLVFIGAVTGYAWMESRETESRNSHDGRPPFEGRSRPPWLRRRTENGPHAEPGRDNGQPALCVPLSKRKRLIPRQRTCVLRSTYAPCCATC